ncbi:MAG: VanW family protein [Patescibacteria group bacterium]
MSDTHSKILTHLRRVHEHPATKAALIWTGISLGVLVVLCLAGGGAAIGYERMYEHRIFPGVRAWGVRLDGLTENEARIALNQHVDSALKDGLHFTYDGRDVAIPSTIGTDPDTSQDLIQYDIEAAVQQAIGFGRSNSFIQDTVVRWTAPVHPKNLNASVTINAAGVQSQVMNALGGVVRAPQDARLNISWKQDASPDITVTDATDGTVLIFPKAMDRLTSQAKELSFSPITLDHSTSKPSIAKAEIEPLIPQVANWLKQMPITLTVDGKSYLVPKEQFASWITAAKKDGKVSLALNPDTFHTDIRAIAPIESPAKKGSLTIQDGKITSFETGTTGVQINDDQTMQGIVNGIATTTTFPIIAQEEQQQIDGTDPQRLGIKEIIGIGTSDFSGSPTNRIKNIGIGVSKVNGSLIGPGEEFSLLKTLGPITADYGWLPELVIKGNKTTPELGGGLCQIGTTAFRAALNSGMKITERQNHSYRVRYYEPAGTDATIYDPAPDFKFVNDTANSILIHAYIKGTIITYEFWGTKDGRVASVPTPKVYNIVAPPPKKLVETTSIKAGTTKCTETAHAGADATLDYTVTLADGTVRKQTFNSHYKPWQAVCLVGVDKLSTDTATSTADVPMNP